MTGSGDNQTLTKDVNWPFMLNTECHYLDMDAIELVLKSAVISVQCFGDSCASLLLSERAKHQPLEQRANAMREQWNENPL